MIPDSDDRRIAPSLSEWNANYKEFMNYTRMNIVMLLSSCFETYLRTIIALAFESKPGVIIQCPDSVDGLLKLRNNYSYGNCNDSAYMFTDYIKSICEGEWNKRFSNFEKYFGNLPTTVTSKTNELDKFRKLRNDIAHHFGRTKQDYSSPLLFEPKEATRISADNIKKLFRLILGVVEEIDDYLKTGYIGSYDIIKMYYQYEFQGRFTERKIGQKARAYQRILGQLGMPPVGSDYYKNLLMYCSQDDLMAAKKFGKRFAIKEINKRIFEQDSTKGHNYITKRKFNLYIAENNCKSNSELCLLNTLNLNVNEYLYTEKLIEQMVTHFTHS